MQEAVELVGHLIWPITLLVVFLMLRRQIRQAADAIGKRMGDRSSDPVVDQIPPELKSLGDRYLAVSIPDWAARVRAKDDLTLQMGSYIITHRIPRDLLADQENEGLLVGLASAIDSFMEGADQSLRTRIDGTRSIAQSFSPQG